MRRILLLLVLGCVAATAAAGDSGPAAVTSALERMAPDAKVTQLGKAPLPGFYQALVGGRMVYVSADGNWIIDGRLYDADKRMDMTEASMRDVRREALAALPDSKRIIYAPEHPTYTVTVFTDPDCGFCRAFHRHIKAFNAEGIAVEYVFWPRSGLESYPSGKPTPTYLKAASVWCAEDRKTALSGAMAGKDVPQAECTNPVAEEYRLGKRIGIDGTPSVVAADGTLLGGYMTPEKLLAALKKNAKQSRK